MEKTIPEELVPVSTEVANGQAVEVSVPPQMAVLPGMEPTEPELRQIENENWLNSAADRRRHRNNIATRAAGVAEDDLIKVYFSYAGEHKILTREEEIALAQAYEAGISAQDRLADFHGNEAEKTGLEKTVAAGKQAEHTLIASNLKLVISVAKHYPGKTPLLDRVQEGNLGLMHAITKFDWRKGFKFSTYATWWIKQAITRGMATTSTNIRLPNQAADELRQYSKSRDQLRMELGREPTNEEILADTGIRAARMQQLLPLMDDTLSLETPVNDAQQANQQRELKDILAAPGSDDDYHEVERRVVAKDIFEAINRIVGADEQESLAIFLAIYYEGKNRQEVAKEYNLTIAQVSRRCNRIMGKLAHPASGLVEQFRDYF